jgi:hypothetical protein
MRPDAEASGYLICGEDRRANADSFAALRNDKDWLRCGMTSLKGMGEAHHV